MNTHLTYLLLDLGAVLFPFILSFDKKVGFYKKWRYLFPGILVSGLTFLVWDVFFTEKGVWSFNPQYVLGAYYIGLPLEEYLFFLVVPYACVFIYECVRCYFSIDKYTATFSIVLAWVLVLVQVLLLLLYNDRLYTLVTFSGCALLLLYNLLFEKPAYLGSFFLAYAICLIPFSIVNGLLTSLPVVIYNNAENLSFRLGTIPVEDTMYNMLLLLLTVNVYERLKSRQATTIPVQSTKQYVQSASND